MAFVSLSTLTFNPTDGIFIGDIFGFILALPISLFLAYWLSAVKNHFAVVIGAFVGALIGFLILLAWAGPLLRNTDLEGANGGSVFFGSLLLCSILAVVCAMTTDLLIARSRRRDYIRQAAEAHERP
ncbi:MAG: PTS sucrose transporter subunit IIBC [Ktedonobacteraceae bacterium]|nr:PTS sucrose transporter subunit IIBC [Ktedonobacteraceae bacterium]MBV9616071.1 PTS sucrose transporter subunit IIBC [Ktedonobacteraceae bacterium]MBV9710859.1 PTS sucrose transporter subunit IIBC [Ktedonobacteraceae bacterium]